MFLRAARQWPVRSLVRAPRRAFAHGARINAPATAVLSTRNSAIIVPNRIAGVTPADLIQHIRPIDSRDFAHDRVALILLTPAFAPWLLTDAFVTAAVSRVYGNALDTVATTGHPQVHTLVAVVDKLPTPEPISDVAAIEGAVQSRMRTPPVTDIGHEGLAYTTLRWSDIECRESESFDEKAASVAFITSTGSAQETVYTDVIRLPLANTIFQTGRRHTMYAITWEKYNVVDELRMVKKTKLEELTVKLRRNQTVTQHSALSVPLIPLTAPRAVEPGMGNIIRCVYDSDGKSVPASQELEKVVPEYFKARNEPPQSVSVWALVMPRDMVGAVNRGTNELFASATASSPASPAWEKLWSSSPPVWNDIVSRAIAKGARLHRVMSGGGGWGKKAGLLSLEPLSDKLITPLFEGHEGEPMELASALQQVVHEGDFIQFFASPPAGLQADMSASKMSQLKERVDQQAPWMWELGTTPSTADQYSPSSWQTEGSKELQVYPFRNVFGALTEGDMIITRQVEKAAKGLDKVAATKVTVPFSRFCSANMTDRPGEEWELLDDMGRDVTRSMLKLGLGDASAHSAKASGAATARRVDPSPPILGLPSPPLIIRRVAGSISTEQQIRNIEKRAAGIDNYLSHLSAHLLPRETETTIRKYGAASPTPQPSFRSMQRQASKLRAHFSFLYTATTAAISSSLFKQTHALLTEASLIRLAILRRKQRHIRSLAQRTDRIATHIAAARETVQRGACAILARAEPSLNVPFLEVEAATVERSVAALSESIMATLGLISKRTALDAETNNSAINIYILHVFLRWSLRSLSLALEDSSAVTGPKKMEEQQILAQTLAWLRAFNGNLFVGIRGKTPLFFREKLQKVEDEGWKHTDLASLRGRLDGNLLKLGRLEGVVRTVETGGRVVRYFESESGSRVGAEAGREWRRARGRARKERERKNVRRESRRELLEEVTSWLTDR